MKKMKRLWYKFYYSVTDYGNSPMNLWAIILIILAMLFIGGSQLSYAANSVSFTETWDKTQLQQLIQLSKQNEADAHEMAEQARALGYSEDNYVILAAKDEWATNYKYQKEYEARLVLIEKLDKVTNVTLSSTTTKTKLEELVATSKENKDIAHEIAENMRERGYADSHEMIQKAKKAWSLNNEYQKAYELRLSVITQKIYSPSYFKKMGVIKWGGYKYTFYSQKVLPGGGLKIPGRHVNADGYVCDKDGYICLANSAPKGTVFPTPFGAKGKVYDRGTYGNHLDVYCNF